VELPVVMTPLGKKSNPTRFRPPFGWILAPSVTGSIAW
jgi:hypothetical protein